MTTPAMPDMAVLLGQKVIAGKLTETEYPIKFQFNPKTITLSHSAITKEAGAGEGANIFTTMDQLGLPSLKLQDTIFDGANTLDYCEQLMYWSYALVEPKTPGEKKTCPTLTFQWSQFQVQGQSAIAVTISKVDITYERFTPQGKPIRATVKLDLKPEGPSTPGQQNPTSGGLPGRGGHVMISGETLPGVALDEYGDPGNWRVLAEANQLDDPLRLRPGTSLYLPSRAELGGGGAA